MPVSITIPARVTVDLHGHLQAQFSLPVTDSGTVPITVTVFTGNLSKAAQAHPAASWITAWSPQAIRLRPGQTRTVSFRITVQPHTGSAAVANVGFRASAAGGPGQIQVSGAVASSVTFTDAPHAGRPVAGVAIHHAPPASASDGGLVAIAGVGLTGAVALALVGRRIRRTQRRAEAASVASLRGAHRKVPVR